MAAIGLGVGVFFSGLIRGAEIIGQNPAVQNTSEKAQEFVTGKTDIDAKDVLGITTDEANYNQGEHLVITVRNIGDHTLTFPDSALGLEIQRVGSGQKYSIATAQVITELSPDESKKLTWDEIPLSATTPLLCKPRKSRTNPRKSALKLQDKDGGADYRRSVAVLLSLCQLGKFLVRPSRQSNSRQSRLEFNISQPARMER